MCEVMGFDPKEITKVARLIPAFWGHLKQKKHMFTLIRYFSKDFDDNFDKFIHGILEDYNKSK